MNKTRLSLFYLGSYLVLIGLGLLFAPQGTLKILQSNRDYDDVFPRIAGMLMSGLGLSISKALMERMSGDIGFDCKPGEGTVFYVTLPRAGSGEMPQQALKATKPLDRLLD